MVPYRARAALVWLFAVTASFWLEGSAAAQDPTLLVNGSFEQAAPQSGDTPDGWWHSERSGPLTVGLGRSGFSRRAAERPD
jgi:hypothetical protein